MTERPGAFVLAMEAGGAIHLVSDLPRRVTMSKVLWDAIASGSHPKARITHELSQADGIASRVLSDLVIETVECTFRYRRVEEIRDGEQYLLELVSRTEPREPDPPIIDLRDPATTDLFEDDLLPPTHPRGPRRLRPGFNWPRGV